MIAFVIDSAQGCIFFNNLKDWQTLIAGLIGFGGLAWVAYRNAALERRAQDSDMQSKVLGLTLEMDHISRDLKTAATLLENKSDATAQRLLSTVFRSTFIQAPLDRTFSLPPEFVASSMDFMFTARDCCERYSSGNIPTNGEAAAALRHSVSKLDAVKLAAENYLSSENAQLLK